jgi:putative DNA primase/helicase
MQYTIESFKTAMQEAGITPPENIIGDDNLHRFKIDGKLDGAYVLHLDGRAAGYFQDFKQGIKQNWKLEGNFKQLTDAERQAFAIERQRQALERQAEESKRQNEAVKKAAYIWSRSTHVKDHQYLTKKGVKPHSARCYRGCLVIPLYDENGAIVSLQSIGDDGSKRMMKGGKAQGSCCFIGGSKPEPGGVILICEGWATGASLYQATGHFTIVAFSAGNLKAVARQTRKHHQDIEIIICGDNDESGVGQQAARAAALAIGGKYILPPTLGQDWNDYLIEGVHESI